VRRVDQHSIYVEDDGFDHGSHDLTGCGISRADTAQSGYCLVVAEDTEETKQQEPEEDATEAAREELLERVKTAASSPLPEVPEWEFKRPAPKVEPGGSVSARGFSLGFAALYSLVVPTVGGLLIGWLVDERLGTGPTWLSVGFLVGALAGFVSLIRIVVRLGRED